MFKSIFPLSLIISFRFLGLFIVLPIISIYALSLEGQNSFLIGIAVGGYAITQMLLQAPFGALSDKIGRKKSILIGLLIFIVGSLICAFSSDIYGLIIGRLLQGAGAIAAVISAYISDLTSEEIRPKAMAIMGGMIGLSFALSMILGPVISSLYGFGSLFIIGAVLAFISIIILYTKVPKVSHIDYSYMNQDRLSTKEIILDKNLSKMHITNFLQKAFMTATFVIIPFIMINEFSFDKTELFKVYLPAMILGILAMGPASVFAQKRNIYRELLIIGVIFFILSFVVISYSSSFIIATIGVSLFFIGFNIHEPIMQSLASRFVKSNQKGKVLGIFNSFGYLGTFIGGFIGASAINFGFETIFMLFIVLSFGWIVLLKFLDNPKLLETLYLDLDSYNVQKADSLKNIEEVFINRSESILVVKYEKDKNSENIIKDYLK